MADVKVRVNQPRFRRVSGVQLRPGLQRVTGEQWKKISSHPVGVSLIEKGVIEEVKAKSPGRPSAADLAAEVAETYDMERLRELAGDTRKTVSEAAQAQIERINATAG